MTNDTIDNSSALIQLSSEVQDELAQDDYSTLTEDLDLNDNNSYDDIPILGQDEFSDAITDPGSNPIITKWTDYPEDWNLSHSNGPLPSDKNGILEGAVSDEDLSSINLDKKEDSNTEINHFLNSFINIETKDGEEPVVLDDNYLTDSSIEINGSAFGNQELNQAIDLVMRDTEKLDDELQEIEDGAITPFNYSPDSQGRGFGNPYAVSSTEQDEKPNEVEKLNNDFDLNIDDQNSENISGDNSDNDIDKMVDKGLVEVNNQSIKNKSKEEVEKETPKVVMLGTTASGEKIIATSGVEEVDHEDPEHLKVELTTYQRRADNLEHTVNDLNQKLKKTKRETSKKVNNSLKKIAEKLMEKYFPDYHKDDNLKKIDQESSEYPISLLNIYIQKTDSRIEEYNRLKNRLKNTIEERKELRDKVKELNQATSLSGRIQLEELAKKHTKLLEERKELENKNIELENQVTSYDSTISRLTEDLREESRKRIGEKERYQKLEETLKHYNSELNKQVFENNKKLEESRELIEILQKNYDDLLDEKRLLEENRKISEDKIQSYEKKEEGIISALNREKERASELEEEVEKLTNFKGLYQKAMKRNAERNAKLKELSEKVLQLEETNETLQKQQEVYQKERNRLIYVTTNREKEIKTLRNKNKKLARPPLAYLVAVAGVVGTLTFGTLYTTQSPVPLVQQQTKIIAPKYTKRIVQEYANELSEILRNDFAKPDIKVIEVNKKIDSLKTKYSMINPNDELYRAINEKAKELLRLKYEQVKN